MIRFAPALLLSLLIVTPGAGQTISDSDQHLTLIFGFLTPGAPPPQGERFERYPPEAAVSSRVVEFTPSTRSCMTFSVERTDGRQGGNVCLPVQDKQAGTSVTPQVRVGVGGVIQPKKIKDVAPVTPPEAIAAGIEGVVVVDILLDTSGKVSEARVIRSIPLLHQAALDCVRQWEFTPAVFDGVAVPLHISVTVTFTRPRRR